MTMGHTNATASENLAAIAVGATQLDPRQMPCVRSTIASPGSPERFSTVASQNPARMLGLEHLTALTAGAPANFNLYNEAGERLGSIFHGRQLVPERPSLR